MIHVLVILLVAVVGAVLLTLTEECRRARRPIRVLVIVCGVTSAWTLFDSVMHGRWLYVVWLVWCCAVAVRWTLDLTVRIQRDRQTADLERTLSDL